ncbi:MAG: SRPBCC family protein [Schleiferiaceae bacterium]|jgi:hypothetical protein|nr:SRPBCC family protein [Schleiferiaceae bacterium]
MKYSCQVEINQPIAKVVELFKDPNNLKEWQDGFLRLEHVTGTPETNGAKSKLFYKFGKNEMELLETIQKVDWPNEFTALYEHKHMSNTLSNKFTALGEHTTLLVQEVDYLEFKALIPRILSILFPGMFRRQVQKWLDQFKAFAEKQ